jgi:hypothetical protein
LRRPGEGRRPGFRPVNSQNFSPTANYSFVAHPCRAQGVRTTLIIRAEEFQTIDFYQLSF